MAKKPIRLVSIEIDGTPYDVPADQYLLWTARELGYDIPHFCSHKWLEPFGGCRMCLVKIELGGRMMPKLQTACSTKPADGMKVFTRDPQVIKVRQEQLEFHLINHPLECPVCDKGGECMLQDQVNDHGWAQGRYVEEKRVRPDAIINEYIRINYKRCIQCKRCVHFGEDIDGSHLLKFVDRAAETRIEGFPVAGEAPRFTGNTIDMCPVGALTARSYRFMGRPWEQELRASVGSLDSVGANIWVCGRLGEVARLIPRDNPEVEDGLIDDATRFSFESVDDERRVTRAIVRENGAEELMSRTRGEELAAARLVDVRDTHGRDSIGVIAGGGLNTEEYLALKLFCGELLDTAYYHFGEELLGPSGADDAAFASLLADHAPISDILAASTVLVLGADLFEEAPSIGLRLDVAARRGRLKLLTARSTGSDTDHFAARTHLYPYGDLLRVVRGLANHLAGRGEAPPELKPLADELRSIGEDCAILYGDEVWRSADAGELIRALAGLRRAVAAANPQAVGVYLNAMYPSVNSAGALAVGHLGRITGRAIEWVREPAGGLTTVLSAAAEGQLKALLIVDADPLALYPDRGLVDRALANTAVVYVGPFRQPTAERAVVHLPLGTWAHREGTVVSLEWRVQKRCAGALDTLAPSLLDVLNRLAAGLGAEGVGDTIPELAEELGRLLPGYPGDQFAEFPKDGVLWQLSLAGEAPSLVEQTDRPPEAVAATGELRVVPKRFLYNDRSEIRFSPVFERVTLPFFAFVHPDDVARLGLAEGDEIEFGGEGGPYRLPVKAARWVRPGSVVVNDYCLRAPANALAGVVVSAGVAMHGGGS
jgi:NADH dehydrogenase/NADH:ubiquinone oxidoreductase subunit G